MLGAGLTCSCVLGVRYVDKKAKVGDNLLFNGMLFRESAP